MEDSQVWNLKSNGEKMQRKPVIKSDGNGGLIINKVHVYITTSVLIVSVWANLIMLVLVNPIKASINTSIQSNVEYIKKVEEDVAKLKEENVDLKICIVEIQTELKNINNTLDKIERKL